MQIREFFFEALQLVAADQHAHAGTAPHADHDRHGSGQAQSAGTGDDQDGDGVDDSVGHGRGGAGNGPNDEGDDRRGDHRRNEVAGDHVRDALDGGAAALGGAHHLDNPRQQSVPADLASFHNEAAGSIDGRTDDGVPSFFRNRDGLASDHRFVYVAATFDNLAIDRHFFAGTDPEPIADGDLFQWYILFRSVLTDDSGGLGRQTEQRLDRRSGATSRPEFEHLTEQHQCGDHCRRLEVDGHTTIVSEGGWEDPGCHRRHDAVPPSRYHTDTDECEHVQIASDQGAPAPLEQRPTAPQNHRSAEGEFDPRLNALRKKAGASHGCHCQNQKGQG